MKGFQMKLSDKFLFSVLSFIGITSYVFILTIFVSESNSTDSLKNNIVSNNHTIVCPADTIKKVIFVNGTVCYPDSIPTIIFLEGMNIVGSVSK
jgi:hypothetical protein